LRSPPSAPPPGDRVAAPRASPARSAKPPVSSWSRHWAKSCRKSRQRRLIGPFGRKQKNGREFEGVLFYGHAPASGFATLALTTGYSVRASVGEVSEKPPNRRSNRVNAEPVSESWPAFRLSTPNQSLTTPPAPPRRSPFRTAPAVDCQQPRRLPALRRKSALELSRSLFNDPASVNSQTLGRPVQATLPASTPASP
jgi:hypothetical protein